MKKVFLSFLVFCALVGGVLWLFDYSLKAKTIQGACVLCDPKVIERQKFYEDELVVALYDRKPICEGHCILIPKRHVDRLENLTDGEMQALFHLLQKTVVAAKRAFDAPNYLILQKNGASAGQTVPHVHIHLIPRKEDERSLVAFLWQFCSHPFKTPLSQEQMDVEREKYRENL